MKALHYDIMLRNFHNHKPMEPLTVTRLHPADMQDHIDKIAVALFRQCPKEGQFRQAIYESMVRLHATLAN